MHGQVQVVQSLESLRVFDASSDVAIHFLVFFGVGGFIGVVSGFGELFFSGLDLWLENELHDQSEGFGVDEFFHFLIEGQELSFGQWPFKLEPAIEEILNSDFATPLKPLLGGFFQIDNTGQLLLQLFRIKAVDLIVDKVILATGPLNKTVEQCQVVMITGDQTFLLEVVTAGSLFAEVEKGGGVDFAGGLVVQEVFALHLGSL